MKGIKNRTKNYMRKLENYASMHNEKAIRMYRNKCYINSLLEIALANRATNKKITVMNHGKELKIYEEDITKLIIKLNSINYEDEDMFLLRMIYAEV